jgi:hypothetical protein
VNAGLSPHRVRNRVIDWMSLAKHSASTVSRIIGMLIYTNILNSPTATEATVGELSSHTS